MFLTVSTEHKHQERFRPSAVSTIHLNCSACECTCALTCITQVLWPTAAQWHSSEVCAETSSQFNSKVVFFYFLLFFFFLYIWHCKKCDLPQLGWGFVRDHHLWKRSCWNGNGIVQQPRVVFNSGTSHLVVLYIRMLLNCRHCTCAIFFLLALSTFEPIKKNRWHVNLVCLSSIYCNKTFRNHGKYLRKLQMCFPRSSRSLSCLWFIHADVPLCRLCTSAFCLQVHATTKMQRLLLGGSSSIHWSLEAGREGLGKSPLEIVAVLCYTVFRLFCVLLCYCPWHWTIPSLACPSLGDVQSYLI